jgi:hypothetical protein
MSHDHNGRVDPPRCEECNAPLGADDGPYLCQDCEIDQLVESDLRNLHAQYLDSIAGTRDRYED